MSRDKRGLVEQKGIELCYMVDTWQWPRDDAGDEEYYSKNNLTSACIGNLSTR